MIIIYGVNSDLIDVPPAIAINPCRSSQVRSMWRKQRKERPNRRRRGRKRTKKRRTRTRRRTWHRAVLVSVVSSFPKDTIDRRGFPKRLAETLPHRCRCRCCPKRRRRHRCWFWLETRKNETVQTAHDRNDFYQKFSATMNERISSVVAKARKISNDSTEGHRVLISLFCKLFLRFFSAHRSMTRAFITPYSREISRRFQEGGGSVDSVRPATRRTLCAWRKVKDKKN